MPETLIPFEYEIWGSQIIKTVMLFVYQQLRCWREYQYRTKSAAEFDLASDLVKYLINTARSNEEGFEFNHEERQTGNRTVDIAAYPYGENVNYNKIITVFECKLLPTPDDKDRDKREYVFVSQIKINGKKKYKGNGGIQRFKLELHGAEHDIVSMVGFVQSGTIQESEEAVNKCIAELSVSSDDNLSWNVTESIRVYETDNKNTVYHGISTHPRKTLRPITIHHLWVKM
ncbi:MAG: hypothetical protein MdMp014T_0849 [Treponematales bacterium]